MFSSLLITVLLAVDPVPTPKTGAAPKSNSATAKATNVEKVDFARDIAPLLKAHCYECHGPEADESGLRLDVRIAALAGGDHGPLLVAGKSAQSELVHRIISNEEDKRMPPDGERLSDKQIALIKIWIDQGANWPDDGITFLKKESDHWSFQPPKLSPLPMVRNKAWVRNSIDRFVLSRLESNEIVPSVEADRHSLLRRLYLDLIGLPPTLQEIEEFMADTKPGAYERLVDRLLASKHFGERWGRHWLDLARYADSNGYELDTVRPNAWRYRDWVVQAMNNDMPFDQFATEQIAGDLFPQPTLDQQIAVGFHQMTINNTESGINKEDYRNRELVDRVNTFGTIFLGLSISCAQCHSHKYDPISQREYYQLYAFLNHTERLNRDIEGTTEEQQAYREAKAAHDEKVRRAKSQQKILSAIKSGGADKWRANVIAENQQIEQQIAAQKEVLSFGVDEWFTKLAPELRDKLQLSEELKTTLAIEDVKRNDKQRKQLFDYFKLLTKKNTELAEKIRTPKQHVADLTTPATTIEAILVSKDQRTETQLAELDELRNHLDAKLDKMKQQLRQLNVDGRYLPKPSIMTMTEKPDPKRQTYVLLRGDFKQKGAKVESATFAVLHEFKPRGKKQDRLDLARWLFEPANPLTARVAANRIWQHLFGTGIVETVDDFGNQGELPSHPRLLDWLAIEFQRLGWSRKKLIRTIVLSSTYRQASNYRPELKKVDPLNRLLARQSRFRVEGEIIRDLFLTTGGLLHRKVGGPTIRPPIPESIRDLAYKYKLVWPVNNKPDQYRRGLYIHFRRSNPFPSLMVFDCPESTATLPRRNRSNTPLQALTTLNDPVLLEGAQSLGRRILTDGPADSDGRIRLAARICLTRELKPTEVETLKRFYQHEREAYEQNVDAASEFVGEYQAVGYPDYETAAWVAVARTLMNLDEFLTRE